LEETQRIIIDVEKAKWFELLQEPTLDLEIAGKEVSVVYIRIWTKQIGFQKFQFTTNGSHVSDTLGKKSYLP
jgi:hypothetical protein